MSCLGIYIREKDGWHYIERGPNGETRCDGTAEEFDFPERLMMALTLDWNHAVVVKS